MAKRKWTRAELLRNLQVIGHLNAPLPPTLGPSRGKRKATAEPSEPNKRLRTDPEEGEVAEDSHRTSAPSSAPSSAPVPALPSVSTVPIRRPKAGKSLVLTTHCEALHTKYHAAGRRLKYSGDARFWSTYPSSHKEYRPLHNPPPQNSPYYKHGGVIARLELLDALVCFTYSIWNRDYCRRSCSRETWSTIDAFLLWCRAKWQVDESTTDAEKALLGLIYLIEGFIHGRKLVYNLGRSTPYERELDKLVISTRAAIASAATESAHPSSGTVGSLSTKSSSPAMLPSPASLAPSANSTPTNRDAGTPNSTQGSSSGPHQNLAPSTIPSALLPSEYRHVPLPSNVTAAMENATISVGPRLVHEIRNEAASISAAASCMNHSQTLLNLPVLARFFPTTFARMVYSTLSPNEEHEVDFEDDEGELFWPGQSATGDGLGWVCLLGRAMIREYGKQFSYRGLDGVVPKPGRSEDDGAAGHDRSTPLGQNSPLPR